MFRSLARNVFINGVAYFVVGLVGLLLAPFLIAAYGLAGYGQILLARLFLPSVSFGFLDLGIGETATRSVAAANRGGDWQKAARTLTLLCVVALGVSAITAAIVVACAWQLPSWLSLAADQRPGFTAVMLVTAALQPVLFLSLVAEGVLKGFERFKRVRSCEVASALLYCGLAIAAGLLGKGPNWVALALLAGLLVRALMAGISAVLLLRRKQARLVRWCPETRQEVMAWSRVMLFNKVIGVAQTQLAAPLVGVLIGPAAVGAFDAVTRLPRFAKVLFGLLSSTVLPVAVGLKELADTAALKRLGGYGMLAALLISIPPLAFAMAYSRSLMHYWIGDQVIGFWGWQSVMFLIPVFNIVISFGGAILLADRAASAALNRLGLLQVLIQVGLSLGLVGVLDQWSFVLGQVISVAILFPFQFALMRRALQLGTRPLWHFLGLFAGAASFAFLFRLAVPDPSLVALLLLGAAHTALIWLLAPWAMLNRNEQARFWALLRAYLAEFGLLRSAMPVSAAAQPDRPSPSSVEGRPPERPPKDRE